MEKDDYYQVLKISKSASQSEIKKTYRKLAIKWHPDKNKAENAADVFANIKEAYDVLRDEKKRKLYDQHGHDWEKVNEMGGMGGMNGMNGMFNMMRPNKKKLPPTIQIPIEVMLEQLFKGFAKEVKYTKNIICKSDCGEPISCEKCDGKGMSVKIIKMGHMITQQVHACSTCNGTGHKTNTKNIKIRVTFEKETDHTCPFIIKEKGHEYYSDNHLNTADIAIVLQIKPHKTFKHGFSFKGVSHHSNLLTNIKITSVEALCGWVRTIKGLDDKDILVRNENTSQNGDIMIIRGQGLYRSDRTGRGDLFIQMTHDKINLTIDQRNCIYKILSNGKNLEKILELNTEKEYLTPIEESEYILSKELEHNGNDSGSDNDEQPQCVQQ